MQVNPNEKKHVGLKHILSRDSQETEIIKLPFEHGWNCLARKECFSR
jgi:hypothetical protein